MPRVVPSQVVAFLEDRFQQAIGDGREPLILHRAWVRGLVALVDRLPNELLPVDPAEFAELVASVEALRGAAEDQGPSRNLNHIERNAVRELHRILQACADEAPAADTTDPAFIDDPELRADIHRDLGEVNRALQNDEWKAATVLAGSVVETLLLWALQNRKTPVEIQTAAAGLGRQIDLNRRPPERWDLHEFIEYAHATNLISVETRTAADQGRDFRNLSIRGGLRDWQRNATAPLPFLASEPLKR